MEQSQVILNKTILIVLLKMSKDSNMINNFYNLIFSSKGNRKEKETHDMFSQHQNQFNKLSLRSFCFYNLHMMNNSSKVYGNLNIKITL